MSEEPGYQGTKRFLCYSYVIDGNNNLLGFLGFQSLVMFQCAIINRFQSYMYEVEIP